MSSASNGERSAQYEAQLITQAQAGNRQAFGELVNRYHGGVINVVYRMCGDAWLSQDAAQIAFIQAWESLPKFRPRNSAQTSASFRNWLYRIAVNAALDILRREKPTVAIEDLPLADHQSSLEDQLEQRERQERIRQAVLALPEASRAVLILREYEGLSYREIAETLDIPLGTVMSRLNYARNHLMGSLRPYLEESQPSWNA